MDFLHGMITYILTYSLYPKHGFVDILYEVIQVYNKMLSLRQGIKPNISMQVDMLACQHVDMSLEQGKIDTPSAIQHARLCDLDHTTPSNLACCTTLTTPNFFFLARIVPTDKEYLLQAPLLGGNTC